MYVSIASLNMYYSFRQGKSQTDQYNQRSEGDNWNCPAKRWQEQQNIAVIAQG